MTRWVRDLKLLGRMNWPVTIAALALLMMGVLYIYSACYVSEDLPVRGLYKKQLLWIGVGLVSYIFFALYDYEELGKLAPWIYGISLVLLVAVLVFADDSSGARRRLMVFGIGIQPSELSKLAVVLILAGFLGRPGLRMREARTVGRVLGLVLPPMLLTLLEPDLGTTLIFVPVAAGMMFVAGVRARYLLMLASIVAICGAGIVGVVMLPERLGADEETQKKILACVGMKEYQKKRVVSFFRPDSDPLGSGWNHRQSRIAVGSGGPFGKGFLRGTQNVLGFLPRSVAPTDFIYSVIAEEAGFVGSVALLLLFGTLVGFGMQSALLARDLAGRLICVGTVTMLFCHAFVNIAMTVGMLPITGLPLPLLSYGGSFMIVTMSLLGITQSVHIRARRRRVGFE